MKRYQIYLSPPDLCGAEHDFIQQALASNWMGPVGPQVDAFAEVLEAFVGGDKKIALLQSGTAAIHLGLHYLGIGPGDVVLVASLTHNASVNPIVYLGGTPVLVDSEYSTWNMCPEALEMAIQHCLQRGKIPKAIVTVHLYGMPYQVSKIHRIASQYGIPVLEDSAEALGSTYQGQACGTFGALGVFSFNSNKMLTTSGGGALVCNSEEACAKIRFWANQSKDPAPYYQHTEIGYNYAMANIAAAIGLGQMVRLQERIAQKRALSLFYQDLANDLPISVLQAPTEDYQTNAWLQTILFSKELPSRFTPAALQAYLEGHGVESRRIWKPMHLQPVFAQHTFIGNRVAEDLFERGLCLPSGTQMQPETLEFLQKLIRDFFVSELG